MLQRKWKNKDVVHISHRLVEPAVFGAILQYIYTGRLYDGLSVYCVCNYELVLVFELELCHKTINILLTYSMTSIHVVNV